MQALLNAMSQENDGSWCTGCRRLYRPGLVGAAAAVVAVGHVSPRITQMVIFGAMALAGASGRAVRPGLQSVLVGGVVAACVVIVATSGVAAVAVVLAVAVGLSLVAGLAMSLLSFWWPFEQALVAALAVTAVVAVPVLVVAMMVFVKR